MQIYGYVGKLKEIPCIHCFLSKMRFDTSKDMFASNEGVIEWEFIYENDNATFEEFEKKTAEMASRILGIEIKEFHLWK